MKRENKLGGQRNPVRRRDLIAMLGGVAALQLSNVAEAQAPDHVRLVAVIRPDRANDAFARIEMETLRQTLRNMGWEEGRDLRIDIRWSGPDLPQIRADAASVVKEGPDVIVIWSNDGLAAVLAETKTIPTVFASVGDPVGSGFVASLAHPGGNATGFMGFDPSMAGKWLQLLKDATPRMARAGLLYNSTTPVHAVFREVAEKAASALSVTLVPIAADDADSIARGIRGFGGKSECGLIVLPHYVTDINRDLIIALAAEQRMPAIYPFRQFADTGGLIYYGIDEIALDRKAALYIDRILKGEKPGDLPVQAPDTFDLVVNLKTAKSMGFEFPPTFLARANSVIE